MTRALFFGIIDVMRSYTKRPWSGAERGILLAYYYTIPREELYKKLPDRTPGAITKQVFHLRAKGWPFKRCT